MPSLGSAEVLAPQKIFMASWVCLEQLLNNKSKELTTNLPRSITPIVTLTQNPKRNLQKSTSTTLTSAYETLIDEKKRKMYDQTGMTDDQAGQAGQGFGGF